MADIRVLMAQERQARRINHEFASYTKSGALTCTACQLNIKSETLWDGHLRSANHKANVKKSHQVPRPIVKRKIEDVEELAPIEEPDARKKLKPKSRAASESMIASTGSENRSEDEPTIVKVGDLANVPQAQEEARMTDPANTKPMTVNVKDKTPVKKPTADVDENEWAAFERDIASLDGPDYSAATISAAPVSAAQLEAEAESDRKRLRDTEADEEQEEEGRRMEEEFEIMEQIEARVRVIKERREALRLLDPVEVDVDTGQTEQTDPKEGFSELEGITAQHSDESDDDVDDWYS